MSVGKNYLMSELTINQLIDVCNKYQDDRNRKGVMGEIYVNNMIRETLQDKGYRHSYSNKPMTYFRRFHNKFGLKERNPKCGIDASIIIRDKDCIEYPIQLEICNWKRMVDGISPYIFWNRISSKYQKYDTNNKWFHIVAINKANIPMISNYCMKEDILIMPLRSHITKEYLEYLGISTGYNSTLESVLQEKST